MIIVKILGGLGNQLFRYATARRLANKRKTDLKLDISDYSTYKLRNFVLDNFRIMAEIAKKEEIKRFISGSDNYLAKIVYRLNPQSRKMRNYYEEKFYHFDRAVLFLPEEQYLDGYFHSEKYFKDIRNVLLKEIQLKKPFSSDNKKMSTLIKTVNSISVHVRRGDFADNPETRKLHGVYEMPYFNKAVSIIVEKVKNPHFFIFSDDLLWARKNFKIRYRMRFMGDTNKAEEDLILMSLCRHNIIVNSTFGWWGAWLNWNKNKIVISPRTWFADETVETKDLIPAKWIKI